jgi:hypothetical protein
VKESGEPEVGVIPSRDPMAVALRRMNQAAGFLAVGGVLAIINVVMAVVDSRPAQRLVPGVTVGLVSALVCFILAYLIYRRRSRVAAVVSLGLVLPQTVILILSSNLAALLLVCLFLPIYVRGILGAFSYHKLQCGAR